MDVQLLSDKKHTQGAGGRRKEKEGGLREVKGKTEDDCACHSTKAKILL